MDLYNNFRGILPLMDTIISSNVLHNKKETNQFAYYLGNDYGFVSFGKSEIETEILWTPIIPK
jgi:hypothetical protein